MLPWVLTSNPPTSEGSLMTPAFLFELSACYVLPSDKAILSRNGMTGCHHEAGDCNVNLQNTLACSIC